VQRGPIALDRITERTSCVIDDDQIAGYGEVNLRCLPLFWHIPEPAIGDRVDSWSRRAIWDRVSLATSGSTLSRSAIRDVRRADATNFVEARLAWHRSVSQHRPVPNDVDDQWDLSGQVALVTGGTRGLGQAFARGLSDAGARVVITGRSADRTEAVAAELSTPTNQVVGFAADVVDPDAAVRVVATVEHDVGPITLLVNNAGITNAIGAVGIVDPLQWWRVVETNVRGTFLYASAVLPGMRARRFGRIINVASISGIGPFPIGSAYGVSKTAVVRLSETVALETADEGIGVFAYHPGLVRTDMTESLACAPEMAEHMPETQEFLSGLFAANEDPPIADSVRMLLRIAAGDADALSGCYLAVDDDLDKLTQESGGPRSYDQRKLRLANDVGS
jgi:NAD(P)-dependent dehydrogenase (short-subunit alcohol dehydrogenase family)